PLPHLQSESAPPPPSRRSTPMKQLSLFLSLFFLLLPGMLRALPVYEPFIYAPGTILYGQSPDGVLIWAAAGTNTGTAQITNEAGSLSFGGFMAPVGNSIKLQNLAGPAGRLPIGSGVTVNSGTIYYSFLFQARDITA